jgi:hypothetical protein
MSTWERDGLVAPFNRAVIVHAAADTFEFSLRPKPSLVSSQAEPITEASPSAKGPPALKVIDNPDPDKAEFLGAVRAAMRRPVSTYMGPSMTGISDSRALVRQMFANIDRADAQLAAPEMKGSGFTGYGNLRLGKDASIIRDPDVSDEGRLLPERAEQQLAERARTAVPRIYDGAPLPVDFDERALMRDHQIIPSLSITRPDIRYGVETATNRQWFKESGAGIYSYHNNIFSARHNARMINGNVFETAYLDGRPVRVHSVND